MDMDTHTHGEKKVLSVEVIKRVLSTPLLKSFQSDMAAVAQAFVHFVMVDSHAHAIYFYHLVVVVVVVVVGAAAAAAAAVTAIDAS